MNRLKLMAMVLVACSLLARITAAAPPTTMPAVDGTFRPAKIYYGTYNFSEKLVEHPDQWRFVQQHADGVLLHFGFWLNNDKQLFDPLVVGKALGELLNPLKKEFILEVGWPPAKFNPEKAGDMGRIFAAEHVEKIKKFQAGSGIHVDHVTAELRLFAFRQVAQQFPNFGPRDILAQVTGEPTGTNATRAYWPEYLAAMKAGLGDVPVSMGCPPCYVPWEGLTAIGKDFTFAHPADVTPDGKPIANARTISIDGKPAFEAIFNTDTEGFTCDSPYYLMVDPKLVKAGYLEKLVQINRWVHGRGKTFSFIVNAPPQEKNLPNDAWDLKYGQDSLRSLQLFQRIGGRADRYLVESWYDGPFKMVPEDQPGTFTNLVKEVVMYLKGPGQTLDLATTSEPIDLARDENGQASVTIKLTNTGTVACLPALRLKPGTLPATINRSAGEDITRALRSAEGWTLPAMIEPGAVTTITLHIGGTPASEFELEAMWNPQDPSRSVRDTLRLKVTK